MDNRIQRLLWLFPFLSISITNCSLYKEKFEFGYNAESMKSFEEALAHAEADDLAILRSVGFTFDYNPWIDENIQISLSKSKIEENDTGELIITPWGSDFLPDDTLLYYYASTHDCCAIIMRFLARVLTYRFCSTGVSSNFCVFTCLLDWHKEDDKILFLIKNGYFNNDKERDGEFTPLTLAVLERRYTVAMHLVAAGANVAVAKKLFSTMRELLLTEFEKNYSSTDPLQQYEEMKRFFVKLSYIQALFSAVELGDVKKLKIILSINPTIPRWLRNRQGETLWHIATRRQDKNMLVALWWCASPWADLENYEGKTFVECALASQRGDIALLEFCMELARRTTEYERFQAMNHAISPEILSNSSEHYQ